MQCQFDAVARISILPWLCVYKYYGSLLPGQYRFRTALAGFFVMVMKNINIDEIHSVVKAGQRLTYEIIYCYCVRHQDS